MKKLLFGLTLLASMSSTIVAAENTQVFKGKNLKLFIQESDLEELYQFERDFIGESEALSINCDSDANALCKTINPLFDKAVSFECRALKPRDVETFLRYTVEAPIRLAVKKLAHIAGNKDYFDNALDGESIARHPWNVDALIIVNSKQERFIELKHRENEPLTPEVKVYSELKCE